MGSDSFSCIVNPETLVVIPARGGSRGIPRKNLVLLEGKPLIAWTIQAAKAARHVTRVIVSTDDPEIAEVSRQFGAETPFLRPAEISGGEVFSVAVPVHALKWLRENEGYEPARVLMLLPTSPLRQAEDIDGAIELFAASGAPSVVSVEPMDKQLPHLRRLVDGRLEPLIPFDQLNVQRQGLEPLYVLNGSIYVTTPATLLEHGTFHLRGAAGYPMLPARSIDINSPEDLLLAAFYLNQTPSSDLPSCP